MLRTEVLPACGLLLAAVAGLLAACSTPAGAGLLPSATGTPRTNSTVVSATATAASTPLAPQEKCQAGSQPAVGVVTLQASGGRVDWAPQGDQVAFDMEGPDGAYDVYAMKPDGSARACLTCDIAALDPKRHYGNPAWHPGGRYVVFQGEKSQHRGSSDQATPGYGRASDLWLLDVEQRQVFRLVRPADSTDSGVLHPHFSHDGTMLSWSEMVARPNLLARGQAFGLWKLMVADFVLQDGIPRLGQPREFTPLGPGFYENHGFSPDDGELLFTASAASGPGPLRASNIYRMVLATGQLFQLTERGYNEHAGFSPDGRTIAWMSNAGNKSRGTDFWLMDAGGSNKRRLTFFNVPGCPHYTGQAVYAADSSWSPDGRHVAGYVLTSLRRQTGSIVRIDLAQRG